MVKFDKKSCFLPILRFTNNEYANVKYLSKKDLSNTGIDKIPLMFDCINRSILNASRQAILYSFGLNNALGHKLVRNPLVIQYKKIS